MIQATRFRVLNSETENTRGDYVLYWMQSAQRTILNHALEYGIDVANRKNLPLIVLFCITADYPEANLRHYKFMIEGLRTVASRLYSRGISFFPTVGDPENVVVEAGDGARLVVVDDGYTGIQRRWRRKVAEKIHAPLVEVSTNVIVPVTETSDKQEYAARTIRPKITRQLTNYSVNLDPLSPKIDSLDSTIEPIAKVDLNSVLETLDLDRSVGPVSEYKGGEENAELLLEKFIDSKLDGYAEKRNDPSLDYQSGLSPYFHFGQISPLRAYLATKHISGEGPAAFIEELVIRRELAVNFVYFNNQYDSYEAIPDWAKRTLATHENDERPVIYSRTELENADTHDEYWNAAQREMVTTGKMHGYMRMYWAKKILEWTASPQEAFKTALWLNDKYELDGRDPNGYCGVSWCFGTHDRPWQERSIFGTVRYMVDKGLKRKFNIDQYVRNVNMLKLKY